MTSKVLNSGSNTPMPIDTPLGPFGTEPLERSALNQISGEIEGEVTGINVLVEVQSGKGKFHWRVTDEASETAFLLSNLEACPCEHATRRVRLAVEVLRFCELSRHHLEMNNALGAVRAMAQAGSYHGQLKLAVAEGVKKGRNSTKKGYVATLCVLAEQVVLKHPGYSGNMAAIARKVVQSIKAGKAEGWKAEWGMPPEDIEGEKKFVNKLAKKLGDGKADGYPLWL